jgi:hypothetical protein
MHFTSPGMLRNPKTQESKMAECAFFNQAPGPMTESTESHVSGRAGFGEPHTPVAFLIL